MTDDDLMYGDFPEPDDNDNNDIDDNIDDILNADDPNDEFDDDIVDDIVDDHRRETIAADPEDLEEIASMARETIATDPFEELEHQGYARQIETIPDDAADPFEELEQQEFEELERQDFARETMVADANITEIQQDDHFRDDFDERLGRVRERRARIFQKRGGARPRRRRRLITPGCVALVMGFSIVALALAVLAMFLPPFAEANPIIESLEDSGSGHVDLNSQDMSTQRDGLRIDVLPGDPGQNLSVAIQSVASAQFLANDVPATDWNCQPADTLPRVGELKGSVYSLDFTGSMPQRIGVSIPLTEDADPNLVNLYGWYAEAGRWLFVPSQKSPALDHLVTDMPAAPNCLAVLQVMPPIPVLSAGLDLGQPLNPDIANQINRLYVTGMRPTAQGTLQGLLPANVPENPDFSVLPLISNAREPGAVDVASVQAILNNPEARIAHSANIAGFVENGGYAGAMIDYRNVPPELRNQFSNFVQNLAHALHLQNSLLVVALPPAEFTDTGWTGGAYDWRTLGLFADEIVIRAPLDPTAFTPGGQLENMLRWAVGEVDRYKLSVGLSALSVEASSSTQTVPFDAAWSAISGVRAKASDSELRLVLDSPYEATIGMDSAAHTPYITYSAADTLLRTYWLTTVNALNHRMQMAAGFNLGGFALFDAQAQGASIGLPELLRVYQDGGTLPESSLALRWRVYDASGALISEEIAPPGAEVVYPQDDSAANLRFEVAIIGDIERELGSTQADAIAQAMPEDMQPVEVVPEETAEMMEEVAPPPTEEIAQAATATPSPTIEPTIVPTITPTPEPTAIPTIVPTINAPEVEGTLPADFELGAHITGDYQDEKFNWMRVAGMNWVKIQLRFEPGMNADDYGWQIQLNNENGFKVLLGVVGEKDEVLNPGYFEEYAQFVGRLAEIGANGIEVWNEMNLDREWPVGRIDPALYTQFLEIAYNEIKARNPDTLVISGALAPTGFFGGCTANGCDDGVYYAGLANAGAAQYMDCVGAHYNEGIVSPTQTTGDPRDPYPTRYLTLQTARAADPFGGELPVCYTELGYLTPEGFGTSLPAGFEWAGNVTVAQHASWLGSAALINAQSGNVRLMIIWNLDFSEFEVDPAGGYAIIRPDGGCPACDTLGSLQPQTINP